jgi:glutamine synthetase
MSHVEQSEHTFRYYQGLSNLDQQGKIIAEYCWIDGSGITIRSKSRTLEKKVETIDEVPEWNYDGSSCYQASTQNSEVILKPVRIYRDPFRGGDNIIVMCDSWVWGDPEFSTLVPANTNFRSHAKEIFDRFEGEKPWYGIEQEYSLLKTKNKFVTQPLGWPSSGFPSEQGPYYCSTGANICFGRAIMDAHYKACLFAGVQISGTNAEVMPGQWEF